MLTSALAVIGGHCKPPEFPADPVFQGRAAQAAAALAVAGLQLSSRGDNSVSTVAQAIPENLSCTASFRQHSADEQLSEALSGQIFIPGPKLLFLCGIFTCGITTGCRPSVFQRSRCDFCCSSAVAPASPNGITVFPSCCGLHGH